jgi:hypothetical protein
MLRRVSSTTRRSSQGPESDLFKSAAPPARRSSSPRTHPAARPGWFCPTIAIAPLPPARRRSTCCSAVGSNDRARRPADAVALGIAGAEHHLRLEPDRHPVLHAVSAADAGVAQLLCRAARRAPRSLRDDEITYARR